MPLDLAVKKGDRCQPVGRTMTSENLLEKCILQVIGEELYFDKFHLSQNLPTPNRR